MKSWVVSRYGAPAVLRLVDRPALVPRPDEVVVQVETASVSSGDARVRGCRFPAGMGLAGRLALGWKGPRQAVLGSDCAGTVVAAGTGVTRWRPGDAVLVVTGAAMGCHAEQVAVKAAGVVLAKPPTLGWREAVSLPFGGQTAWYFLKKAGLKAGDEVLVVGAAGAVGSAAVQLVALAGARAIAVTRRENDAFVRSLGAVEVIDYTTTDYAGQGRRFDLVMDCVGAGTFRTLGHLARPGGAYLAVAGGLPDYLARSRDRVRCITGYTPESVEVIEELLRLVMAGKFRPVVGEVYPFAELPAAHARVDSGHKLGTVVVELGAAGIGSTNEQPAQR
jgi:NADPH:quinone reductase-like Zn-dependent oxidoreductase